MDLKNFTDLNLGFSNAENYRRRANKNLLQKYFVRDEYLDKLLDENVYYLVGEKGTGKTAYSTYLSTFKYKNTNAFIYDVRQTEYQKFLEIKKLGHLPLSQYSEVWRTLLLILLSVSVLQKSSTPEFLKRFTKLGALKSALDEFYNHAFSPEIVKVLSFVESSEISSSLLVKHAGITPNMGAKKSSQKSDSESTFQTNLLTLRRVFEEALDSLKLDEDYLIFIDGIDLRPSEISYQDYFECVSGLISAVWSINSDFLSNIKDSKGRLRIVLLVRPDILMQTGLHNVNTKIRDNSVFLNWKTTYKDYRSSSLFKVADRILSSQQDLAPPPGDSWDYYFPFHAENITSDNGQDEGKVNSFLSFLRFSYYRPRDINAMMSTMREIIASRGAAQYVSSDDFNDPSFRDAHADYLLGEIRDQLLFYYSQSDFDLFLKFFSHLQGKRKFSFDEYLTAFQAFIEECAGSGLKLPKFFDSPEGFLQFLYEQNIICYKEEDEDRPNSEPFIRWCFRERTPSNLSPKIRTHVDYEIFYGLTKALNIGRPIKRKQASSKRDIGTVTQVLGTYGFIRGGARHTDYYYQRSQTLDGYQPKVGDKVSFEATVKYGKPRAKAIRRER